jgi:hypothetical protein
MKTTAIMAVGTTTAAATIGLAAPARADVVYTFQTPDRNVACEMGSDSSGAGHVSCETRNMTCRGVDCPTGPVRIDRFQLYQGGAAFVTCDAKSYLLGDPANWPVLDYGQSQTVGTIQCQNAPGGTLSPSTFCTDLANTRHYFHIYIDHYDIG